MPRRVFPHRATRSAPARRAALWVAEAMEQRYLLSAQYSPGFVWNRTADWKPGTVPNSTAGNPMPDSQGNPTWYSEEAQGGSLTSANPWYTQPTTRLIWDSTDAQWRAGTARQEPDVSSISVGQADINYTFASPIARWQNPTGRNIAANIDFRTDAVSYRLDGNSYPIDLAVIEYHSTNQTYSLLWSTTRVLPENGQVQTGTALELPRVAIGSGDSILFTCRIQLDTPLSGNGSAAWFDNASITLEPLVTWTGGGDGLNWTDPNNWSTGSLPGPNDDVSINAPGSPTIQITSGTQLINSLTTADPMIISGGTLEIGATDQFSANLTLAGGTLLGGTYTSSGAANISVTAASSLNAVTLGASVSVANAPLYVQNGLTLANGATLSMVNGNGYDSNVYFQGTQTLGGSGQVLFGGSTYGFGDYLRVQSLNNAPATLTLGPGVTIHGASPVGGAYILGQSNNGQETLLNQGTINADTAGAPITVGNGLASLTNTGPLEASGGTLNISNAPVLGGTISMSNGGVVSIPSGTTLNAAALSGTITFTNETINIQNGLTLTPGTIVTLAQSGTNLCSLNFIGTQHLAGSGQVVLTNTQYTTIQVADAGTPPTPATLTFDTGITVHGEGTILGNSDATLVNNGSLLADVNGQVLSVTVPNFANGGTAQGQNGGILSIGSNGSLAFTAGTAQLTASRFAVPVSISGGDVSLVSATPVTFTSLSLSGGTLDGSAAITLAGTANLSGGTIAGSSPATVQANANVNVSGNVQSLRELDNSGTITVVSGTLGLDGGGSQSGSFVVDPAGTLELGGSAAQTLAAVASLTGAGTVLFDGSVVATVAGSYSVGATNVQGQAQVDFVTSASLGVLAAGGGMITIGTAGAPSPRPAGSLIPAGSGSTLNVVITSGIFTAPTTLNIPAASELTSLGQMAFSGGASTFNLSSDALTPGQMVLNTILTTSPGASATIASIGSAALPGVVDLGGAFTFKTDGDPSYLSLSISAQVTDGAIDKSGPGWMQLASANTYAGGTTFSDGTLEADTPTSLGTGPLKFSGGMLASGSGGSITLKSPLTAQPTDSITLNVSGTMQVPGLTLGSALNVNGAGTLLITGPVVFQADCTINNTANVVFAAPVSGGFGFTKTLTGSLTLSASTANTYTGPTTIDAGTLLLDDTGGAAIPSSLFINGPALVQLQAASQINASANVQLNSVPGLAILDLNNFNQSLGPLTDVAGGSVRLGSGSLSLGGSNASSTFLGSISGSGSLVKSGSGTLTLGGSNTYTGPTTVSGGTVVFNSPAALVAGSLSIGASAQVKFAQGSSPQTFKLSGLSITPGGKLDLSNNALSLSYGSGSDPLSTFRSLLSTGYDLGKWDGTGITSSSASTNPSLYTLSYVDSADGSRLNPTSNSIVIRYGLVGDVNGDGSVNLADLLLLTRSFGKANSDSGVGDFDFDGTTSLSDFLALTRNFGKTMPASTPAATAASTSVRASRRSY